MKAKSRGLWFCVLSLALVSPARADLVLTNFTPTKPMKVMPIGDSITDDCSLNGAWRLYLQPLLQSSAYPFRFVGRQASAPVSPSFNKVNHEGYCGAVIASPGVFAVHGYSTTDAYLLKIVADALAVTNNRPDLVLLLIGANDIGHGRNPSQVATNDMARLLDLIFTNVPNTQVILARISSLQSANLPGLSYAAYATNVLIYNHELQGLVNHRRAAGQNVFLADVFSRVDYASMFMSDHVHPNVLGLQSMASEWLSRIQAITVRTDLFTTTFIHGGDSWKYYDHGGDPGTNWTETSYADSGWSNGVARLGYGEPALTTTVDFGPDPNSKHVTTYFRRVFDVPWNLRVTNLNVRLARADGAAIWLNGQELWRTNLPSGPLESTNLALAPMTAYTSQIFYPVDIPVANLSTGTNLLAVEIHLSSVTNSTLGFDLELIGSGYTLPPPALTIASATNQIRLTWPATNANSFSLWSTTNLAATGLWSIVTELAQTNAGQVVITQAPDTSVKFFRLRRP